MPSGLSMPERMIALETKFDAFQERYDRDTEAAALSRASTKEQLKLINERLAELNNVEQRAIGMLSAARIGWFVLGILGSGASYLGLSKLAAWLLTK